MNPETIVRLREAFAQLAADADGFAQRFYAELFRLSPSTRGMFAEDMVEQRGKFVGMLGSLLEALDSPSRSEPMWCELGRRHVGYGVSEDDYDAVGAALLICLRQRLAEDWNEAMETAWAGFYGELSETMIDAAAAVGGAPTSD